MISLAGASSYIIVIIVDFLDMAESCYSHFELVDSYLVNLLYHALCQFILYSQFAKLFIHIFVNLFIHIL